MFSSHYTVLVLRLLFPDAEIHAEIFVGLNVSEAFRVKTMSTLISAAVHINVAFATFKMSFGLFWQLVMEVSLIDCGRRWA